MTDWTWDEDEQAYRDDDTGELIALLALIALRNRFADSSAERAKALAADLAAGAITLAVWQTRMATLIRSSVIAQSALAVGGVARLTTSMVGDVARIVGTYLGHLKQFAAEIATNALTAATVTARSALYVDAGIEGFEVTRAATKAVTLPIVPPLHPRCRCHIAYGEDDKGPFAIFVTAADERVCAVCLGVESQYGADKPYRGEGVAAT